MNELVMYCTACHEHWTLIVDFSRLLASAHSLSKSPTRRSLRIERSYHVRKSVSGQKHLKPYRKRKRQPRWRRCCGSRAERLAWADGWRLFTARSVDLQKSLLQCHCIAAEEGGVAATRKACEVCELCIWDGLCAASVHPWSVLNLQQYLALTYYVPNFSLPPSLWPLGYSLSPTARSH